MVISQWSLQQFVDSSCTNNKSWADTSLCVRDNDRPFTAVGEQLFMFVGKSCKNISGRFQSRAVFIHVDKQNGATSTVHPAPDWEFSFMWTPEHVSKSLKLAVAALKPEDNNNKCIPKTDTPKQTNDDQDGGELACQVCLSGTAVC